MPSTPDNTGGIRRFAALLESKPLGVSSLEEAQQFLFDMGVPYRFACRIHEREHRLNSSIRR
jgi:hypothetical protein